MVLFFPGEWVSFSVLGSGGGRGRHGCLHAIRLGQVFRFSLPLFYSKKGTNGNCIQLKRPSLSTQ